MPLIILPDNKDTLLRVLRGICVFMALIESKRAIKIASLYFFVFERKHGHGDDDQMVTIIGIHQ